MIHKCHAVCYTRPELSLSKPPDVTLGSVNPARAIEPRLIKPNSIMSSDFISILKTRRISAPLITTVLLLLSLLAVNPLLVQVAVAQPEIGGDLRVSTMGPNGNTDAGAFDPAVAYNSNSDQYLVVWAGDNIGALGGVTVDDELGIWGQLVGGDGSLTGSEFIISNAGASGDSQRWAVTPNVVFNSSNNEFLVVWYSDDPNFGLEDNEYEIFGQRVDSNGTKIGNNFRISDAGPDGNKDFDAQLPDVAYNSSTNQYLVVWYGDDDVGPLVDNDNEIFGQLLDTSGAEVGINDFRISTTGPTADTTFQVNDAKVVYNPDDNQFLVVWEGDIPGPEENPTDREIIAQRLSGSGALLGSQIRVSDMGEDINSFASALNPAVAYSASDRHYLVTWNGDDITGGMVDDEAEVYGQLISPDGSEKGPNDFRISQMGVDGSTSSDGSVDSSAGRSEVVYAGDGSSGEFWVTWPGSENLQPFALGEREIFAQRIASSDGTIVGSRLRVSEMGPDGTDDFFAETPQIAYNPVRNELFVTWYGTDNTPPLVQNEIEVFAQRIDASPDSDRDGVADSVEMADGTNPADRGSKDTKLGNTICMEWNGFLGPILNIIESVNLGNTPINFVSRLYNILGVEQSALGGNIPVGTQSDTLVHDMLGFTADTYGQVCVSHGAASGDLDGRIVYYKLNPGEAFSGSAIQYAFALPFNPGEFGSQYVPFNTFQPSLNPADSANLVANWIQISNVENSPQTGTLFIYNQVGQEICRRQLGLAPASRQDTPAHAALPGESCGDLGPSQYGLVEWRPSDASARFLVRNVRYLYDNPGTANNFVTAFQLEAKPGNGELTSASVDMTVGTTILEVVNTTDVQNNITSTVYDSAGNAVQTFGKAFAPRESVHYILNGVLTDSRGSVEVDGSVVSGTQAVAMHYGRAPANPTGLSYMYGVGTNEAIGTVQRGTYNTFLDQGCGLFINNPSGAAVTAMINLTRFDGTVVRPNDTINIPAHGSALYDCGVDQANVYGVIRASFSSPAVATAVRRGVGDAYSFPTPVR